VPIENEKKTGKTNHDDVACAFGMRNSSLGVESSSKMGEEGLG